MAADVVIFGSEYRDKMAKLFLIVERRKKMLLRADRPICDAAARQILQLAELDAAVTRQIRDHGNIHNLARRR